jgi:hypothetical protein
MGLELKEIGRVVTKRFSLSGGPDDKIKVIKKCKDEVILEVTSIEPVN